MAIPLRLLILEDQPADAELSVHELRRAGYEPVWVRVDDEAGFRANLHPDLDVILADYQQPQFDGLTALEILRETGLDVPFILVSGALGEEVAAVAVRAGAADYVLKDRLGRLGTTVRNALDQRELRRRERQATQSLRSSQQLYEDLVNSIDGMVWEQALPDRHLTFVSQNAERLLGYPRSRWLEEPGFWLAHIHPDDRDVVASFSDDVVARGASGEAQYRMLASDGRVIWVRDHFRVVVDPDGPGRLRGVVVDITPLKRTEGFTQVMAVVAEAANRASTVDEAMQVGVDEICTRVGWPVGHVWMLAQSQPGTLQGTSIWHLRDARRYAVFCEVTEGSTVAPSRVRQVAASGHPAWIPDLSDPEFSRGTAALAAGLRSAVVVPVLVGTETVALLEFFSEQRGQGDAELTQMLEHVALQLGRVVERARAQRALEHQASYDSLTDLPNRMMLRERLGDAIEGSRLTGRSTTLLLLDLDNFKEVNDTFGHHAGDMLLRQVGPRLRERLRESDTVARLGGDEFAILLPGAGARDATRIAATLLATLQRPMMVEGQTLDVRASIGIATCPDHGADAEVLLQRADVAMYLAKGAGSGHAVYSAEQDPYDADRLVLMADLRQAIELREISIAYQPKVDMASRRITGLEALARWHHPQRGSVPPTEFVPLAERMGLIRTLTNGVLEQVLRQCRVWQDSGIAIPTAVNLSMRDLLDPEFSDWVVDQLTSTGVQSRLLSLEITETAVMGEPARVMETMRSLRELGIGFAVDDFGTGYSSLAYLQRLPVQEIKIDRSFVGQMASDPGSASIVRATVDLGQSLGLDVVAEGVEDMRTWDLLTACRCTTAQGYLISQPLPAGEIEAWLRDPVWRPALAHDRPAAA
jgi:diguanylate cyclase (GGDEF)-like protein/PAS domain S-box-containing protein